MKLAIYQTLDDKENADYVEEQGPFKCTRSDAWLGHGYYLWETYINLAHFWGQKNYDSYIVCKGYLTIDESCYDLYNNSNHRLEFEEMCKELVSAGISRWDKMLVAHVIEFLKRKGKFKYKAIRVLGTDSISNNTENKSFISRILFRFGKKAYFDMMPQIQICLIEKKALSLQDFSVVYPIHYVSDIYA